MSKLFKLKKSACVLSVLVLGGSLAACGGGGGGGAMSATTSSGLDTTTTATTPTPPITSQPSTVSTTTQLAPTFKFEVLIRATPNITVSPPISYTDERGITGTLPATVNDDPNDSDRSILNHKSSRINLNSQSLTHLAVDNIDLDIVTPSDREPNNKVHPTQNPNFYSSSTDSTSFTAQARAGSNLSYAVWGVATYENYNLTPADGDQAEQAYLFAQGLLTKDMPTTGVASYAGLSIYQGSSSQKIGDEYKLSAFNVDFARRTLSGTINDNDGTALLNLSANISGNGFYGVGADGTHTTGAFYGPKAAELAGGFYNIEKNITGAFGAKKN